jgi:transcriptional regulator with XRE-family HTH domain
MSKKTQLFETPPYAVERQIVMLAANLRVARVRRKLTIADVAEKIGTGVRAVADAEKGKVSTGVGVYMALLWAYGLLDQMDDVAAPEYDLEGQRLALSREKIRARSGKAEGSIDNDF